MVSAAIRLRAGGIVRLRKYSQQLGRLNEYRGGETDADDSWFFVFDSFETRITDEGRRFWDVPRTPIGFQSFLCGFQGQPFEIWMYGAATIRASAGNERPFRSSLFGRMVGIKKMPYSKLIEQHAFTPFVRP